MDSFLIFHLSGICPADSEFHGRALISIGGLCSFPHDTRILCPFLLFKVSVGFFQFLYICITSLSQIPRLWKAFARWFWRPKAALAGELNGQKPNANTEIHLYGLHGTFSYSSKFFCLVFLSHFFNMSGCNDSLR